VKSWRGGGRGGEDAGRVDEERAEVKADGWAGMNDSRAFVGVLAAIGRVFKDRKVLYYVRVGYL
jgi:hypothetical protein